MAKIWHKYGYMSSDIEYLLLFFVNFLMQFGQDLPHGKTVVASSSAISRGRSSMIGTVETEDKALTSDLKVALPRKRGSWS